MFEYRIFKVFFIFNTIYLRSLFQIGKVLVLVPLRFQMTNFNLRFNLI